MTGLIRIVYIQWVTLIVFWIHHVLGIIMRIFDILIENVNTIQPQFWFLSWVSIKNTQKDSFRQSVPQNICRNPSVGRDHFTSFLEHISSVPLQDLTQIRTWYSWMCQDTDLSWLLKQKSLKLKIFFFFSQLRKDSLSMNLQNSLRWKCSGLIAGIVPTFNECTAALSAAQPTSH